MPPVQPNNQPNNQPGMPNPYQYPAPPPEEPEQSPYDFFMNPQDSGRRSILGGGSPSNKMIWIIAVVLTGLIIAAIMLFIASSGKSDTTSLVTIAQTQQEIIRVSGEGNKKTKSTKLQNFAVTTQLSMMSAQRELTSYISKQGTKLSPKELALGRKSKTDQAFAAAVAANTFDTTFASTMKSELDRYERQLADASGVAATKAELDLLISHSEQAQLLRRQLLAP